MSLSPDTRRENRNLALTLMLEHLGEDFVGVVYFEIASTVFADIEPTTWRDLQDDYLIEDKSTSRAVGMLSQVLVGERRWS